MAETTQTTPTRKRKTRKSPKPLDTSAPFTTTPTQTGAITPVEPTQGAAISYARDAQARFGKPTDLNLPEAGQYIPSDYTSDSSSLQRTPDGEAEAALQGIREKKNTVAVITENLQLANALMKTKPIIGQTLQTVAKGAAEFEKVSSELLRHEQALEAAATEQVKLVQKRAEREGLESLTGLIQARFEAERAKAQARITRIETSTAKLLEGGPAETTVDVSPVEIDI